MGRFAFDREVGKRLGCQEKDHGLFRIVSSSGVGGNGEVGGGVPSFQSAVIRKEEEVRRMELRWGSGTGRFSDPFAFFQVCVSGAASISCCRSVPLALLR